MNAQQLADRTEIADLVYRLGVVLDEGRFDQMPTLFVADATAQTPGGTAEGRDAVVAQARHNHDPDRPIQHVTTNVLVELDGDRAEVRANVLAYFGKLEASGPLPVPTTQFVLGAVDRFEVVRTPEGWRFSRVEAAPVWATGTRP